MKKIKGNEFMHLYGENEFDVFCSQHLLVLSSICIFRILNKCLCMSSTMLDLH